MLGILLDEDGGVDDFTSMLPPQSLLHLSLACKDYLSCREYITNLKPKSYRSIGSWVPKCLTSLNLSDNKIGNEGSEHIAKLSQLTSLNLTCNNIGNAGAEHLLNQSLSIRM